MKAIGIVVLADLKPDYIFVDGILFVSTESAKKMNMGQGCNWLTFFENSLS